MLELKLIQVVKMGPSNSHILVPQHPRVNHIEHTTAPHYWPSVRKVPLNIPHKGLVMRKVLPSHNAIISMG